jgi:cell division protein FtsZ
LEDLDNEEIISLVEVTPTAKRSKELFNEIRNKAQGSVAIEPMSTENATIISFN